MIPQQTQYSSGVTLAPARGRNVGLYCSICFRDFRVIQWVGSFKIKDSDDIKKVTLKRVHIFQTWSRSFHHVVREFILGLNSWGPYSSLERERKRAQIYVVVVQWRQRNIPNSVLHVQIFVLLMKPICFYVLLAVAFVVVRALWWLKTAIDHHQVLVLRRAFVFGPGQEGYTPSRVNLGGR